MQNVFVTFCKADQASLIFRRVPSTSIRAVRIVRVAEGYQLQAILTGSPCSRWRLTSPGGISDTFGDDLEPLRKFANVVLGRSHTPVFAAAAS